MKDERKTKKQLISELTELRQKHTDFEPSEAKHEQMMGTLQENGKEFKALYETMPLGVVYQAADGRITSANPAAEKILGISLDQMQGRTSMDPRWRALHEDGSDFPGETHPSMMALETGKEVQDVAMGVFNPRYDEIRWIRINAVPQFTSGVDKPFQVYTTFEDVTERKQAEEELEDIFNLSPDMVAVCTTEGKFLKVNPTWEKVLGYTQKELLDLGWAELLHPDDVETTTKEVEKRLEGSSVVNFVNRYKCKDGSYKTLEWQATYAKEGIVHATARDITELRQAQERLQFLSQIIEQLSDSVIATDLNSEIVWTNQAFKKLYGYSLPEVIGRTPDFLVAEPSSAQIQQDIYETVSSEGVWSGEVINRRKDGGTFVCELRVYPLVDEGGNIFAFASQQRDITERKQVEFALQETEQRYRSLVETSQDLIFMCDTESRFTYLNPAWENAIGYGLDEMLGRPISDFKTPEIAKKDLETFNKILKGQDTFGYETVYISKSGEPIDLIFNARFMKDVEGNIIGTLGTAHNITERKQAEQALSTSQESYKRIVEDQTDFIVRWRPGGIRTFVNASYCQYYGLKSEEALGTSFLNLVSDEYRDVVQQRIALLTPQKPVSSGEHRVLRPDGTRGWNQWTDRAFFDEKGDVVEYQSVGQDITERKQAVEALRESEEKFRIIFESAPDAYYLSDLKGKFIDGNKAAEIVTGYRKEELIGKSFLKLNILPKNQLPKAAANLVKNALGKPTGPDEFTLTRKDGGEMDVEITTHPVNIEGKTLVLGIARDITERKQAEAEITRLATVIEQAPVTVVITDLAGDIIYANPEFEASTGYTVVEALGQNPRILKSGLQDAPFYKELWDNIAAGRSWDGIFINKRKDGELYHEEATIFPIKNASGEIVNYATVKRDVSERVQVEKALQDSEDKLIEAQKVAKLGHSVLDLKTGFWTSSPVLDDIFGTDENYKKDIAGWLQIVHPESREAMSDYFQDHVLSQHQEFNMEYKIINIKTGQEKWVHGLGRLEFDNNNNLVEMFGTIQDITDRKQLATQVQEQARQLKQILATVPAGVLLLDAEGRILQANPVAEEDLATLAGVKVGGVLTHLGDRPLDELLTSPLTKGLWHEVKVEKRTFEVIARLVENGPEPEHWVLVVNDVTQEREVEKQLQRQERLAAVGQLASGIAHDFNNILTSIMLYAQLASHSQELSELNQERMTVVNQQAGLASQLIEQILDFSRRGVLERQPLGLLPLLKEQVKLLERTLPEHIKIELNYGQGEYTVYADATRMQQVLTNLAVNARDAMPRGGTLRIGLERITVEEGESPLQPEMKAGEWIRLRISDTGMGISSEVLPHIFEPFFTTKGPGEGTGLGLAQVHGIVRQHEGRIGVETELGEGTTFTIYLPMREGVPPPEPSLAEVSAMPQGKGELLLVVEDETTVRAALVAGLESLNYRVLETANSKEALAVMEEQGEQIAMILSDVVMPVMGGIALFHALRQKGWEKPVILLTGHPMDRELNELLDQGLVTLLAKPPNLKRLAQTIDDALRG